MLKKQGVKMPVIIKVYTLDFELLGWLKSCDFDRGNDTLTGDIVATSDVNQAMRFADKGAAFTYAMTQSKRVPRRPDGQPNRPLTAFTLEFEETS
jgi:hypothetical protein